MNPETADWSGFQYNNPDSAKKKMGQDHHLVELLWQNGQVVMHSQTNRKPSPNRGDPRQPPCRHDDWGARAVGSVGNTCSTIQDDEMEGWIHCPVEDSFEKEFCSQFFGDIPLQNPMDVDKPIRQSEHDKAVNLGSAIGSSQHPNTRNGTMVPDVPGSQMPPPRFQFPDPTRPVYDNSSGGSQKIINFSQFAPPLKSSGVLSQVDVWECSGMTVGSSRCGSNQIPNELPDQSHASSSGVGTAGPLSTGLVQEGDCNLLSSFQIEGRKTDTLEPTLTSSSGGSGSSFRGTVKQGVDAGVGPKRKGREGEESECQSEALEIETSGGKKLITRSGRSTRKSRAAEVHNLSERRRRDRINKKMKALQELIPHCNKTDKASMLDEAIEYLKSLQLQLQVMWMGGGGMAPMMFPGALHYMSSMSMAICPPTMPTVHGNIHMPRIPMVNQSFPGAPTMSQGMFGQTPVLNPMNFPNQMLNPSFPEQFARYMAMHNIQAPPQPGKMFKFDDQGAQQNQTNSPSGSSSGRAADGASSGKIG
ncbi:hypothetical protein MLD38_005121 [Melastoma candidum]|uniref:Uncharacterized protein n=1 Tax=Melastoma candidum TaxID=119954 RepID=A0ACB9S9E6_9MYRT|nr:hypothetical protein MLD38_005121 [Melastoma candidum]